MPTLNVWLQIYMNKKLYIYIHILHTYYIYDIYVYIYIHIYIHTYIYKYVCLKLWNHFLINCSVSLINNKAFTWDLSKKKSKLASTQSFI